jgi:hypothetical protein
MTRLGVWALLACLEVGIQAASPSLNSRLRFEPLSPDRYIAAGIRNQFIFQPAGVSYQYDGVVHALRFEGASRSAKVTPAERLQSVTNRFYGNDRSRWQTGVPNYERLRVESLYPRVDLVYYGTEAELEYDLNVKPGGDVSRIRIRISGESARIDSNGNLTAGLLQKRPVAYQVAADGSRQTITCRYRRNSDGTYGFAVGSYDRAKELIIDPVLTFSSYVAGSQFDVARAIGHDSAGFLYVGGVSYSTDLTQAGDAQQGASGGAGDVFVVKMNPHAPAGSEIVYTTYFGGSGAESLSDMVVSPNGRVYLAGATASSNLPTANAAQSALAGKSDAFVAWLDPSQGATGLLFSTYLGGGSDDSARGIAVDSAGRVFVTGTTRSTDFPNVGGFQAGSAGNAEAFVTGYDPSQSGGATLIYSTYLGGAGEDDGRGVAVDASGNLWIIGGTYSYDFPLFGNSYQSGNRVSGDAFLVQLSRSAGILYSTYLGGTGVDWGTKVRVDSVGRVLATGYTSSTEFPVTADALQPRLAGLMNAFIMVWTPVASAAPQLTYSTYYGGGGGDVPYDIKADADGIVYVTGYSSSRNLFTTPGALQPTAEGGVDGFVLKFNPARAGQDAIDYASYVASNGTQIAYALDVDTAGNIYIVGTTTGSMFADFSTGQGRPTLPGTNDAFVAGFSPCTIALPFASQQFATAGGESTFTVTVSRGCRWTASSPVNWITITPANANETRDVTITVAPNTTGAERQATINIGYQTFLVGQNQKAD